MDLISEDKLLTICDVAEKLGISVKSVRRDVASGALCAVKIKNTYRIAVEDFVKYSAAFSAESGKSQSIRRNIFSDESLLKNIESSSGVVNWMDIRPYWENPGKSEMTFVDLFCGAGGLSKGLELSGLEGICGLDWFEEACKTYERNFKHPFVNGDITDSAVKERFYDIVKKQLNGRRLSVVAGGFPCQGFSMAGNRIVDDPRNSLYKELIEIVVHLQPEFVVCENVKGLRSMLGGMVEKKILSDFKAIGYDMNVAVLCAADYYTPQKRERVIFIGNRIGVKNMHPKPILSQEEYITTGSSIADLMDMPDKPEFNHVTTKHRPDMARRMMALPEGHSLYKGYSDAWKKCPWNEVSCTIKENHGGVNIHPKLPRVLTAREMARLQSFPDDFIFEGAKNKQLVQIGNAVPPLLGKAIGLALRLSNNDFDRKPHRD